MQNRKILLIAYEYPPILSAQSIRWFYLSAELAKLGWAVDVATVEIEVDQSLALHQPDDVNVFRCFPGPYVGIASTIGGGGRGSRKIATDNQAKPTLGFGEWIYRFGRKLLDYLLFPDTRTEWYLFGRRLISDLCKRNNYSCIIASHEPCVDLMLALSMKKKFNLPCIADCGDPIATVYTPKWRYKLDFLMERKILKSFNLLVVTTSTAKREFEKRHRITEENIEVVSQGTLGGIDSKPSDYCNDLLQQYKGQFWLLYTGNFYENFRNPHYIFKALSRFSNVRLLVIGSQPITLAPNNVDFVPKLSHSDCVYLQLHAPVLLSLGNAQEEQSPGKLIEYLGAGRPILHVYQKLDLGADLVESLNRGWSSPNSEKSVEDMVRRMADLFYANSMDELFDLSDRPAQPYSWTTLARKYGDILERVCMTR